MTDVSEVEYYRGKSFDADADFIQKRARQLAAFDRGQCFIKLYKAPGGCWCIGADVGGGNIRCPSDVPSSPSTTVTESAGGRYHTLTEPTTKPFFPK